MGILDIFKKRKQNNKATAKASNHPGYTVIPNEERQIEILNQEIENFFPQTGRWSSMCYQKPAEVHKTFLPCHLADNAWMAQLLADNLLQKGILIPTANIQEYISNSKRFNELKHNYELEIVKWQINYIMQDGDGWIMPEGYDEMSLMLGRSVEYMVRGGVIKTLQAIGMDSEVIEEGLEKNLNLWLHKCISRSFSNLFEPHFYLYGSPAPALQTHKVDWIAAREYEYYKRYQSAVDKYGKLTPAMKLSADEYKALIVRLTDSDAQRREFLDEWKSSLAKPTQMQTKTLSNHIEQEKE